MKTAFPAAATMSIEKQATGTTGGQDTTMPLRVKGDENDMRTRTLGGREAHRDLWTAVRVFGRLDRGWRRCRREHQWVGSRTPLIETLAGMNITSSTAAQQLFNKVGSTIKQQLSCGTPSLSCFGGGAENTKQGVACTDERGGTSES
jgi:hypothetical protein